MTTAEKVTIGASIGVSIMGGLATAWLTTNATIGGLRERVRAAETQLEAVVQPVVDEFSNVTATQNDLVRQIAELNRQNNYAAALKTQAENSLQQMRRNVVNDMKVVLREMLLELRQQQLLNARPRVGGD